VNGKDPGREGGGGREGTYVAQGSGGGGADAPAHVVGVYVLEGGGEEETWECVWMGGNARGVR